MSSSSARPAPKPRAIFDDPQSHLAFITVVSDNACEGQHFDRKEAARPYGSNGGCTRADFNRLQELVQEAVSAFTNASGGLLVLGVSKIDEHRGLETSRRRTGLRAAAA